MLTDIPCVDSFTPSTEKLAFDRHSMRILRKKIIITKNRMIIMIKYRLEIATYTK